MKQSQLLLTACVSPRAGEVLNCLREVLLISGLSVDLYGIQEHSGPHEDQEVGTMSPYAMLVNYKEKKKSKITHLAGNSVTFRAESMS